MNIKKLIITAITALSPVIAMAAASTPDFGQLADNVRNQYDNLALLITGTTYVVGLFYVLHSIIMIRTYAPSNSRFHEPVPKSRYYIELACGVALLFFPTLLAVLETTIFGTYNAVTATATGILIT